SMTGGAPMSIIESPESTFRLHHPTYLELGARIAQYAIEDLGLTKVGIAHTADTIGERLRDGALARNEEAGLVPAGVGEERASAGTQCTARPAAHRGPGIHAGRNRIRCGHSRCAVP